jgi:replicative DNA helicase
MGKTALAANIGFNAARRHAQTKEREGATVGFFSLEMSGEQLGQRVLAEQSGISCDAIRKGQVKPGISTALLRSRSSMPPCRSISNRLPICRSTRSVLGPGV